MSSLNDIRLEIDHIDYQLMDLFVKRMELVKLVITYKKEHQMPVFDEEREKQLIEKNVSLVPISLRPYAKEWVQAMLKISKDYQNE